jgi:phenylacetate-CoA ligase
MESTGTYALVDAAGDGAILERPTPGGRLSGPRRAMGGTVRYRSSGDGWAAEGGGPDEVEPAMCSVQGRWATAPPCFSVESPIALPSIFVNGGPCGRRGLRVLSPETRQSAFEAALDADVDRLCSTTAQQEELQLERLRRLLFHAREASPWHRARLANVDIAQVDWSSLGEVPSMTKADLLENWDGIVADQRLRLPVVERHLEHVAEGGPLFLLDEYLVLASSGSSGTRAPYVWDLAGWVEYGAASARYSAWAQRTFSVSPPASQVMVMATVPTHMSAAMFQAFTIAGTHRVVLSAGTPLDELVAELNRLQPGVLVAYPSVLERLAGEALAGRLRIQPLSIQAGGEALEPRTRQVIRDAFGTGCGNFYGATEAGVIAASLSEERLVVAEDKVLLEPVDVDLQPVAAGVRSATALVTNLTNLVIPLIRYELADSLTWHEDDGAGPFTGRRLDDVHGRSDDSFRYADGVTVHPHVFRSPLSRGGAVLEYQVRQTSDGASVAVRGAPDLDREALADQLTASLRGAGLVEPIVTVRVVERIEATTATGKVRRFVPLATSSI